MRKKERCYLKRPLKILGVTDECCCNCRFHIPLHYYHWDKPQDQESCFKEWVCMAFFFDDINRRSPLSTCSEHGICECWLPLPGETSEECPMKHNAEEGRQ
jgi:hypothetical protein